MVLQDLNQQPAHPMQIDLNGPADQEDNPQEVILNLAPPQGDFLELNDLLDGNDVVEEVAIAQEALNVQFPPIDEQQLLNLADEM